MGVSRRQFLRAAAGAAGACAASRAVPAPAAPAASPGRAAAFDRAAFGLPVPERLWRGESSVAAALRAGAPPPVARVPVPALPRPVRLAERFADLRRHFVVEYYPWYATSPWQHWNEAGRTPPVDLASNYVPLLGAYDSRATAVLEQHARWIAELGAGAINVSWWGRDSDIDRLVPSLMDVMVAHDIHVTFHLEPYRDDHARVYASDIEYLITQYGDRRGWDGFLLLGDERGRVGPVFKSFRTILPPTATDCRGVTTATPDYVPDGVWRQQTDAVRELFAADFDHVTLLADSLEVSRTTAAGFDGIAIYDSFVEPATWPEAARNCTWKDLVFSFSINPGYDGVAERQVAPGTCYRPLPFLPGRTAYDWSLASDREAAATAGTGRIIESFHTTLTLQRAAAYSNLLRGFLLSYVTSFNEWFEGHQFEPMKDYAQLSGAERAIGYHNAADGRYRFDALKRLLDGVLG
jgi:hypothetical protein